MPKPAGRFPGSGLDLPAFPAKASGLWADLRQKPRPLQWRDRAGFSPASLLGGGHPAHLQGQAAFMFTESYGRVKQKLVLKARSKKA